jgi:PAS domain-containing protein
MSQKPLELILARNFLTSLSTPAFLVDESGALIFYNEAAGGLLGISFEESGRMEAEEWSRSLSPYGEDGELTPIEERKMTKALRRGRPAHGHFKIRSGTRSRRARFRSSPRAARRAR